ncbi:NEK8 kinase, partial [Polyodon spathula]|nr:NEK8 kinase [Polyodon spathula]
MTDRGIIMTFGSGSNGCLGHGNFNDVTQPKIVEALLGYELVQVSCGASHVLAVTNEREVFSWGRGDNGRLGLGSQEPHNSPQQVAVPPEFEAQRVQCGVDCSMILTTGQQILACGNNRFNKLGLDKISAAEEEHPSEQVEEVHTFTHVQSAPLNVEKIIDIDIGTAHSIAVTEKGQCFTFGSNQHGQLGTNTRRNSRVPYHVSGLQGVRVTMAACGDAFTVAIGAGTTQERTWCLNTALLRL